MTDEQLAELVRRYQAHLQHAAASSAAAAAQQWDRLDAWDEPQIDEFTTMVTPAVSGFQAHAAALATGFVLLAADLQHTSVPALDPPPVPDWAQGFRTYWKALGDGQDWNAALTAGRNATEGLGFDAVQSAARDATSQLDRNEPALTGWQRIPDGNACDWCLTVAEQTYHSADTADFGHDRCGCTVAPA